MKRWVPWFLVLVGLWIGWGVYLSTLEAKVYREHGQAKTDLAACERRFEELEREWKRADEQWREMKVLHDQVATELQTWRDIAGSCWEREKMDPASRSRGEED
jgi:hypothetical protein